ncbi:MULTISPECIES: upstream stimulatory factor 1 [Lactobacillales]|jgi:cell division protein FtsB|uniref:Upstream stimulatory factor 1 n=1 Tax=Lactobacillus jensenii TaxID=109790 RepID=A0ABU9FGW8_LACJE|nr:MULTISPECIES: upstream stimulatory factor 1 [Lactobacillales]MCW1002656.1 upstream stimulatory factor 1 [Streptococcus anginosus]MCW8089636.1 upstream stimulatory factor 1 [Lactobacillus jensenii]MDK8235025.1 upstream stimulatory factor 1 [Lactobacillus jensenii]MDT9544101.1 upstream stimulatory factor 1 [Lactobacillus jensenii]MDT9585739.1 upstream stimulatory factor 1 [Lactobacillus jensenii]
MNDQQFYQNLGTIILMILSSAYTWHQSNKKTNHDILKDNLNILQAENEKLRKENDDLRAQVLNLMTRKDTNNETHN